MLFLHNSAIYYLSIDEDPLLLHVDATVLYKLACDLWIICVNNELLLQDGETHESINETSTLFQYAEAHQDDYIFAIQDKKNQAIVRMQKNDTEYNLQIYYYNKKVLENNYITITHPPVILSYVNISILNHTYPQILYLIKISDAESQIIKLNTTEHKVVNTMNHNMNTIQLQNGYLTIENSEYTFIYYNSEYKLVRDVEYYNGYYYSYGDDEFRINGYLATGLGHFSKSARSAI